MKKPGVVLAAFTALLLFSCAGLPRPVNESESLVIGSLVLDFPDGFFREPPRTITSGIQVKVRDVTDGSEFWVATVKGGFYYFVSNGSDSYALDQFDFTETSTTNGNARIQGKLDFSFTASEKCIHYLRHLTIRYETPQKVQDQSLGAKYTSFWNYQTSSTADDKQDEMLAFLRTTEADSPWLSYEVK